MTAAVAVVAGLFGLVIGSFLNVVIHRVPLDLSVRYPAVEVLTGGLFVLVALRFGLSPTLPAMFVFVAGLTALACCDLHALVLPKRIVYPTGVLVAVALIVAAGGSGSWHRLAVAAACGTGAFVVFLAIHLASPRAMGFGDVRLAPLISGTLGWVGIGYAVAGFVLANVLGAAVGVVLIVAGKGSRRTALPYGVFLAIGAMAALLLGGVVHYPA
ncbi:MAG: prepilin peptidase [Actinomycetota bacterium]|nr:prepilin peptidase [Actinomycetota bacterium]